ncbi:MAG: SCO family protein [Pseudomonadota bacterium]
MQTKTFAIVAGALTAGVLAATAGFVLIGGQDSAAAQCNAGVVAGDLGGPFELVSETGETVTDADVITEPSLIYFGYTFCPDVCPLDTVRNAEVVDLLAEDGKEVQPIFITVDPARDTVEVVDDFTANIHPDMLGLTGSDEQVQSVSQTYRTYFNRHDDEGDEFYLVDHSTFSYLVTPEAGVVGVFRRELTADQLAEQASCVLDAA